MNWRKPLFALLFSNFALSAQAKIGETLPELIKRFGDHYRTEVISYGTKYEFKSEKISVDVVTADSVSISETYFSSHPLTAKGDPPSDIVNTILNTNAPDERWEKISGRALAADNPGLFAIAAPYGESYMLQSTDNRFIASIKYTRPQPEGVIWLMTVARISDQNSNRSANAPPKPTVKPESASPQSAEAAIPSGSGTGFFVSDDGFLVTNQHVVANAVEVRLQVNDETIPAKVVKTDPANDLALLKAQGRFTALPIASSRRIRLGDSVATIGFPDIELQGRSPKLTRGEINSLTGIQDDSRYFQISAAVQPGNSGGALVDEYGNVVGIVSAKLNQKAALIISGALPENVNYAVKSSFLLGFLESVPELVPKLKEPNTAEVKFADVVEQMKQASALVITYAAHSKSKMVSEPSHPGRPADDRFVNLRVGTWKVNLPKSGIPSGIVKSMTSVCTKESAGGLTVITDAVDVKGKHTRNEWHGKFDGHDYPVVGDANVDTRAYSEVDDYTAAVIAKKAGKIVGMSRSVISADGKSSTMAATGTDASGKPFTITLVTDKVQ